MGRPVTYYDYTPRSIYPYDNQVPELVDQHEAVTAAVPLYPDHIATGARPSPGPFASAGVDIRYPGRQLALYNQEKGFMGQATTWLFISTSQPVRYDDYSMDVQQPRAPGLQMAGTSPNTGVYTGRYELESYSYYGGVQEELPY